MIRPSAQSSCASPISRGRRSHVVRRRSCLAAVRSNAARLAFRLARSLPDPPDQLGGQGASFARSARSERGGARAAHHRTERQAADGEHCTVRRHPGQLGRQEERLSRRTHKEGGSARVSGVHPRLCHARTDTPAETLLTILPLGTVGYTTSRRARSQTLASASCPRNKPQPDQKTLANDSR